MTRRTAPTRDEPSGTQQAESTDALREKDDCALSGSVLIAKGL